MIPLNWVDDLVGFVGEAAEAAGDVFELILRGLVGWVVDGVVWVVAGVFNFFIDSADPNVQADWFAADGGPYATTAGIGAVLMVGFLLGGITQGALAGDVAGMVRRMAVDLPVSVLGMVTLLTLTQAGIRVTDELSSLVMSHFEDQIADFTAVVVSLSRLGGGVAAALVIFILALVTALAGLVIIAELAIRAALIYIVVALCPLVFAARLWPAMQGTCRKLLQLLAALVLSKLVMAVALAVAAAAAVGTGSGGEVTSLPEPEALAEDPGGSITQGVGILLAALAAFGIAAFSPLLVAKLLPITEAAGVAQGLRSGPMRGGQQAMSTLYYGQYLGSLRRRRQSSGQMEDTQDTGGRPDSTKLAPPGGRGAAEVDWAGMDTPRGTSTTAGPGTSTAAGLASKAKGGAGTGAAGRAAGGAAVGAAAGPAGAAGVAAAGSAGAGGGAASSAAAAGAKPSAGLGARSSGTGAVPGGLPSPSSSRPSARGRSKPLQNQPIDVPPPTTPPPLESWEEIPPQPPRRRPGRPPASGGPADG